MKPIHLFALSLCLITTAACQTWDGLKEDVSSINTPSWMALPSSSNSQNQPTSDLLVTNGNCPTLEIVEELSTVATFSDINDPQPYTLISSAHITGAENACEYSGKTATVDIKLAFEGQTGPKGTGAPAYSYPFFVAVTAPNGDILAKEVFNAALDYNPGQSQSTNYESLRQIIPIANQNNGPRYKVLVGFQLTQNQLEYNRAIIAQRIAAAEAAAREAAAKPTITTTMDPAAIEQDIVIIEPAPMQKQAIEMPAPQDQGPIIIVPGQ